MFFSPQILRLADLGQGDDAASLVKEGQSNVPGRYLSRFTAVAGHNAGTLGCLPGYLSRVFDESSGWWLRCILRWQTVENKEGHPSRMAFLVVLFDKSLRSFFSFDLRPSGFLSRLDPGNSFSTNLLTCFLCRFDSRFNTLGLGPARFLSSCNSGSAGRAHFMFGRLFSFDCGRHFFAAQNSRQFVL